VGLWSDGVNALIGKDSGEGWLFLSVSAIEEHSKATYKPGREPSLEPNHAEDSDLRLLTSKIRG
jgi:hypothetical protein